ncbi:hypothetical protein BH09PSE4_BH09PSE4_23580 [soil metagenome]
MRLEISSDVIDQIVAESAAAPDREVCGLLFGTADRVSSVQRCSNVASDPARSFEIDPSQLIAAHKAARAGGPAIVGCYHSHPNGGATPSARDASAATPDGSIWVIAAGGAVAIWRAVENGACEGRFDPVDFCRG